jgi:hypothetical protein
MKAFIKIKLELIWPFLEQWVYKFWKILKKIWKKIKKLLRRFKRYWRYKNPHDYFRQWIYAGIYKFFIFLRNVTVFIGLPVVMCFRFEINVPNYCFYCGRELWCGFL